MEVLCFLYGIRTVAVAIALAIALVGIIRLIRKRIREILADSVLAGALLRLRRIAPTRVAVAEEGVATSRPRIRAQTRRKRRKTLTRVAVMRVTAVVIAVADKTVVAD